MKILMHYRHFPVAMARYLHWAFESLGHEVKTVGSYSHGTIPWGNFTYPEYKLPPTYEIPEGNIPLQEVLDYIDFKPDVVFQAADTIFLTGPSPVPNVIYMTDPHAVDYTPRFTHADYIFCTQHRYMRGEKKMYWIPYAYSPDIHFPLPSVNQYDVVFCGLQYDHRVKTLEKMKEKGLKVFNELGLIYEDYNLKYSEGKIAFNWSSKEDLPARFWEGLAMNRLVLTNRCPDLYIASLNLKEDRDFVAFSTEDEALEKALYYSTHDKERTAIAQSGFDHVQKHTYEERCKKMLSIIK